MLILDEEEFKGKWSITKDKGKDRIWAARINATEMEADIDGVGKMVGPKDLMLFEAIIMTFNRHGYDAKEDDPFVPIIKVERRTP